MDLKLSTCAWRVGLTETFRNRSSKLFDRYGTNMQNPSDRICRIYKAPEGFKLVQVDQAGAEALIVAYLCNKGNLRKLFDNRIKPHVYVAMHLFKDHWNKTGHPIVYAACEVPIDTLKLLPGWDPLETAVKSTYKYYFIGKKTVHASDYDMGPNTFQISVLTESEGKVVLSRREAAMFIEMYHRIFPEVREWHKEIQRQLKATRVLRNLFGFPRIFNGAFNNHKTFKEAYAFIPQSTVGTLANIAFVEEQQYIEKNNKDWTLLNNKHDSTLTMCPEDEVEECCRIKLDIVQKEFIFKGEKFRMRGEASVGSNWGKYHKDNNPDGMKEI